MTFFLQFWWFLCSLRLFGAILEQKESTFICEKKMWFFDTPGTPGAGSIVERIFGGSKQPLCKSCFQGSNSYVSRTTITIPFNKLLYYRPLRTIEYWVELYFKRIPLPRHDPLCLQILFGLLLLLMEAEKIWQNFEMHRSCNLETKIW